MRRYKRQASFKLIAFRQSSERKHYQLEQVARLSPVADCVCKHLLSELDIVMRMGYPSVPALGHRFDLRISPCRASTTLPMSIASVNEINDSLYGKYATNNLSRPTLETGTTNRNRTCI